MAYFDANNNQKMSGGANKKQGLPRTVGLGRFCSNAIQLRAGYCRCVPTPTPTPTPTPSPLPTPTPTPSPDTYPYSCPAGENVNAWSSDTTYIFRDKSLADTSSVISQVVDSIVSQTDIPIIAICVKDVKDGSLIFTVQVLYGSQTAAYQGAAQISQVVLPAALGVYTFTTMVKPPALYSNICFPAGTKVKTDQGEVSIEMIIPGQHTINKKAIEHVTKTIAMDKYLVRVEKDAFAKNKPTKPTVMSKDHQIEYEGELVPVYRFLDYSTDVTKVKYSGELLYNVLLEEYGTMCVNNLTCETLEPTSPIACVYRGVAYKKEKVANMRFKI